MAQNIPTRALRYKITPDDWNQLVNAINAESVALDAVETLTADTSTNGGQGNARLADRLGTGVGTGSNVTTGSATSQLADLRTRMTNVEAVAGSSVKAVDYRLTGATLQLVGQNQRIVWNTATRTHAAITYNSGTGLFTAVASGWYSGQASVRVNASGELYLWWSSGASGVGTVLNKNATNTNLNVSVGFLDYLTAGTTFGVYGWTSASVSATNRYTLESAGDAVPKATVEYRGP